MTTKLEFSQQLALSLYESTEYLDQALKTVLGLDY